MNRTRKDFRLHRDARANHLLSEMLNHPIAVGVMPISELIEKTLQYHKVKHCTDKETLDRWQVNYIRHNIVSYNDNCKKIMWKSGSEEIHKILKERVLKEIKRAYPHLKDECDRQLTLLKWQTNNELAEKAKKRISRR